MTRRGFSSVTMHPVSPNDKTLVEESTAFYADIRIFSRPSFEEKVAHAGTAAEQMPFAFSCAANYLQ